MMPRYIDAQKLKDAMNIEDDANGNFNIMTALKCVDEAPTANAQEVRNGKWILVDIEKGTGVCSNCNRQDHIDGIAAYCRFCGAKMDDVGRE